MAFVIRDRVKDSTTTTGTGDITLSGTAPTGYQTFASVSPVGDQFYYAVASASAADWEVGYGHLSGSTTLVRDRVLDSSNAGALVSFAAGTKDVFMTIPAALVMDRGLVWAVANGYALP